MKVYLAGKVPKGEKEADSFVDWRIEYAEKLETISDIHVLDPNWRNLDESDFLGVVGFDCDLISQSDLVVVYAEEKLGTGTSQELVIAKYLNKRVITVLPKNSHHRRSNIVFHGKLIEDWIHPFIHTFSDHVVEQIEDITKEILQSKSCKDITIIDEAMKYYEKNNKE